MVQCFLRDGLFHVDKSGFNAVDHTLLNFWPVDNSFAELGNPEIAFPYFTFGEFEAHFRQIKAWKPSSRKVDLVTSGGHTADFEGRRVYPFNFLTKHYPIRSQEHGERKIFRDRMPRWDKAEKDDGWHIQYDHMTEGFDFLRRADELMGFDDDFEVRYLLERLANIGNRPTLVR